MKVECQGTKKFEKEQIYFLFPLISALCLNNFLFQKFCEVRVHGRQFTPPPIDHNRPHEGPAPLTRDAFLTPQNLFAANMATNGAPDSWDDDVETANISNKLSDLNVQAPSFVPNVNASVFVPSWLPPAAADEPAEAKEKSPVVEQVEETQPSLTPSPTESQNKMQVNLIRFQHMDEILK